MLDIARPVPVLPTATNKPLPYVTAPQLSLGTVWLSHVTPPSVLVMQFSAMSETDSFREETATKTPAPYAMLYQTLLEGADRIIHVTPPLLLVITGPRYATAAKVPAP